MKAVILTPYIQRQEQAAIAIEPMIKSHSVQVVIDITGCNTEQIIPDVNLLVVEVTCTPETLALIEADPLYKILWSDAQ